MLLVRLSTGRLSASSAIAGYGPAPSSTQNDARKRSASVGCPRPPALGPGPTERLEHARPADRGLVRVGLHLGQGDRRGGQPAVAPLDRVVAVLPALVGQAAPGRVDVLEQPVAVGVAMVGHPGEGGLEVREQLGHLGGRQPPAPGVVEQA